MKTYVLGFCFDRDHERVVLVEKCRPTWQAGRLNGVGGKVEDGETADQAMAREFREETGCEEAFEWVLFGCLSGGDWKVWLFYSHYQEDPELHDHDGELSGIHFITNVLGGKSYDVAPLSSLLYLIPMALNHTEKADGVEFYEIREDVASSSRPDREETL